uniref:Na_H_Exchanger domain-containing protein n=1 Tax=Haemonchus contortus TaxID=6289 RepID=A0A7I4YWH9_HAECO
MSSTTECSQLVIEPSEQTERRWKLPVIYSAEISSCCAYLLFVALAFATCNSIIETSVQNKSLSDAHAVPTPPDYATSIYSLLVIVSLGVVFGYLTQLCRLPSLLGMLVVGITLRNLPAISDHLLVVKEWSVVLRRIAFVVILLRGGLSLDANAIRKLKGACVRLALVPCSVETVVVAVAAKLIFGMDIIFGVLLGAVLAAVSPAVVIPALLDASKAGYGVKAGVPSLVIAAASLDDVYAISIFSLALSLLFSSGTNMEMTILAAPVEVFSGIFFGSAMDGAGAVAVLVAAFISGHSWKKEGPLPEEDHLANLWHLAFQPLLFGLIGFELSFDMVQSGTIFRGCLLLGIGLLFRFIASFLAVFVTTLTMRERLFVAVAWMPKATVQAALAPVVLDMARSKDGVDSTYVDNGIVVFTIAVLSILITAPVGAFLIRIATPLLLTRDEKSVKFTGDGENELENDMNESAENTL